jgi:uncharacterized ubiquitin-like protein YukD
MSKSFDTEVRLEAEVEYEYREGTPHKWDRQAEQHYPGDEPEIVDMRVYVNIPIKDLIMACQLVKNLPVIEFGDKTIRVDITGALSKSEISGLTDDCFSNEAGDV